MNTIEAIKDLNYYLSLPYTTVLRRDAEGDVVARVDELPGCIAHGKDNAEALSELESMKRLWIEDCLGSGQEVPEPQVEEPLPSGKWVQRVPRSLHAKLTGAAKQEGVSLNQLVTSILSERFGARAIEKSIERMMADYISAQVQTNRKSLWNVALSAESTKHSWDFGTSTDCLTTQGPHPNYAVHHWRTMGSLIPSKLEVKVENATEKNPEGAFAYRR
jgi:antitoxin HicB